MYQQNQYLIAQSLLALYKKSESTGFNFGLMNSLCLCPCSSNIVILKIL